MSKVTREGPEQDPAIDQEPEPRAGREREATLILTSAWFTLLTHRLLDTPLAEAQAREVWIIADEVQTLRRLEALELLLTQGAKRVDHSR